MKSEVKTAITDPWHHSQSWAAHGHQWQFNYDSFNANYTIENSDRSIVLSVPIRETNHYPSPQAWLDHWAKTKGKRQLKQNIQELEQPSLLEQGNFRPANDNEQPSSVESNIPENSLAVEVVNNDDNQTLTNTDELTDEEERDRLHLERKVERAFYEAGKALYELRKRRLYRSTHKTFEDYCQERFGYSRRKMDYLIAGSQVYKNLSEISETRTNGSQNESVDEESQTRTIGSQKAERTVQRFALDQHAHQEVEGETRTNCSQTEQPNDFSKTRTIGSQILPTSERQVRPLTKLKPHQQREAWAKAVEESGGKVPSSRVVKDIVDQIREQNPVPNPWREDEVAMILVKDNPDLRGKGGCWAVIKEVHDFSCTVRLWDGDYQVKPENLKELPYSNEQQEAVRELSDRLTKLYHPEIEEAAKAILSSLGKIDRPYLTDLEERLLTFLEENN